VLAWRVVGDGVRVAGDEVLPGTSVALTTSKGPAPRAVPDVVGLTLEDAQAAAAAVQLSVVAGEDVFSDDVPVGIVVSQDTAADNQLPRDGSFTVLRSKGLDLIALPALEGLSFNDAQSALIGAGFTIGSLLGTTEGAFESISISAEPVGDMYRRGTAVDLIFL
jgi:beta-lactam-binding protein with PASTA domain